MTTEICRHQRQLVHCAVCASEAERRHAAFKAKGFEVFPTDTHDETGIRKQTVGGDAKFRFALVKRSNDDPIPEDEPIFILRARDNLALPMLRYYEMLSLGDRCNNHHLTGLATVVEAFEQFTYDHPDKMKQPGVTRG